MGPVKGLRSLGGTAVLVAALLAAGCGGRGDSPDPPSLKRANPARTALMDIRERQAKRKGKAFRPVQIWVPLERISPHLQNAVIAAEDGGFYRHNGVEWGLMREALIYDLKERRLARGASTITQQLAKNLYLSPSKDPLRKVRELLIAFRLEKNLSKRRILELYLNVVEWGEGIFGAEAAARAYFDKSAADLTLEEAVALAAVLPSPRRHSPLGESRWVKVRRAWVERRMRATGRWPQAPAEDVSTTEAGASAPPSETGLLSLPAVSGKEERLPEVFVSTPASVESMLTAEDEPPPPPPEEEEGE